MNGWLIILPCKLDLFLGTTSYPHTYLISYLYQKRQISLNSTFFHRDSKSKIQFKTLTCHLRSITNWWDKTKSKCVFVYILWITKLEFKKVLLLVVVVAVAVDQTFPRLLLQLQFQESGGNFFLVDRLTRFVRSSSFWVVANLHRLGRKFSPIL